MSHDSSFVAPPLIKAPSLPPGAPPSPGFRTLVGDTLCDPRALKSYLSMPIRATKFDGPPGLDKKEQVGVVSIDDFTLMRRTRRCSVPDNVHQVEGKKPREERDSDSPPGFLRGVSHASLDFVRKTRENIHTPSPPSSMVDIIDLRNAENMVELPPGIAIEEGSSPSETLPPKIRKEDSISTFTDLPPGILREPSHASLDFVLKTHTENHTPSPPGSAVSIENSMRNFGEIEEEEEKKSVDADLSTALDVGAEQKSSSTSSNRRLSFCRRDDDDLHPSIHETHSHYSKEFLRNSKRSDASLPPPDADSKKYVPIPGEHEFAKCGKTNATDGELISAIACNHFSSSDDENDESGVELLRTRTDGEEDKRRDGEISLDPLAGEDASLAEMRSDYGVAREKLTGRRASHNRPRRVSFLDLMNFEAREIRTECEAKRMRPKKEPMPIPSPDVEDVEMRNTSVQSLNPIDTIDTNVATRTAEIWTNAERRGSTSIPPGMHRRPSQATLKFVTESLKEDGFITSSPSANSLKLKRTLEKRSGPPRWRLERLEIIKYFEEYERSEAEDAEIRHDDDDFKSTGTEAVRRIQTEKLRRGLLRLERNALERARHEQEAKARSVRLELLKTTSRHMVHSSSNFNQLESTVSARDVSRIWSTSFQGKGKLRSLSEMMVLLAAVASIIYSEDHPLVEKLRRACPQRRGQALRLVLARYVLPHSRALVAKGAASARSSRELLDYTIRYYAGVSKQTTGSKAISFDLFLGFLRECNLLSVAKRPAMDTSSMQRRRRLSSTSCPVSIVVYTFENSLRRLFLAGAGCQEQVNIFERHDASHAKVTMTGEAFERTLRFLLPAVLRNDLILNRAFRAGAERHVRTLSFEGFVHALTVYATELQNASSTKRDFEDVGVDAYIARALIDIFALFKRRIWEIEVRCARRPGPRDPLIRRLRELSAAFKREHPEGMFGLPPPRACG